MISLKVRGHVEWHHTRAVFAGATPIFPSWLKALLKVPFVVTLHRPAIRDGRRTRRARNFHKFRPTRNKGIVIVKLTAEQTVYFEARSLHCVFSCEISVGEREREKHGTGALAREIIDRQQRRETCWLLPPRRRRIAVSRRVFPNSVTE